MGLCLVLLLGRLSCTGTGSTESTVAGGRQRPTGAALVTDSGLVENRTAVCFGSPDVPFRYREKSITQNNTSPSSCEGLGSAACFWSDHGLEADVRGLGNTQCWPLSVCECVGAGLEEGGQRHQHGWGHI